VHSVGTDLPLEALVVSTEAGREAQNAMMAEAGQILVLADRPLSIAEVSAHLGVHLGIARVLVSDLVAQGYVEVSDSHFDDNGPDLPTLERLLDDLQAF
jgi:predicted ArsR family transcriptional regulator